MSGRKRTDGELAVSDAARFWAKVGTPNDRGCMEWQAGRNKKGYGKFSTIRRSKQTTWKAHRFAWTVTNGRIPPGLVLLHSCDNPCCVNPRHLTPGTSLDNTTDMIAKGRDRGVMADNTAKPNCPKCGDSYTEWRIPSMRLTDGSYKRRCVPCDSKRRTAWQRARRRAKRKQLEVTS